MITRRQWRPFLLLDFDTFAEYRAFPERARFLSNVFSVRYRRLKIVRRRSSSRKWHVIVYLLCHRLPPPLFIVAAQAICGSDWKRETFNLLRAKNIRRAPREWQRNGRWNTLYREKL